MFGKKSKKKNQAESSADNRQPGQTQSNASVESRINVKKDKRFHAEGLGEVWAALTGQNPQAIMAQVVGTVLHEGGTRPPWQWKQGGQEYVLMAWPKDQPIRAAVLMGGPEGGQLKPVTAVPLLEGFPNDLTVEETHPRQAGMGGDVAVNMLEGKNPMWFFDPLFGRDCQDLTPGVTHTFWLAAAAFGIRKALLDEIAITSGPQYESYAENWLQNNPGKNRLDVPPLKLDIRGKTFIMPGRAFGEYQLRATIDKIDDCQFDKMPVKVLYLSFPFEDRPKMYLALYAAKCVLGDFEPGIGQEVEAYAWFQGRIIDLENPVQPPADSEHV